MHSFKKHCEILKEKKQFVSLTDKETKNTIGVLNTSDDDYHKTIQQIKNKLMQNNVKDYLTDLLEKNNISLINLDRLMPLYLNHFKGDSTDFLAFTKLKPYKLNYKSQKPIDISNINGYYSKYLDETFFKKLVVLDLKGLPNVGPGEAYLALMTHITNTEKGVKGGDLQDGSQFIEVKAAGGRFGGQRVGHDGIKAMEMLEDILPGLYLRKQNKTFNKRVAASLSEYLRENPEVLKNKKMLDELIKALSNYNVGYKSNMKGPLEDAIRNDKGGSHMTSFIATLHMYGYQKHEGFDWLIFFNDKKTKILGVDPTKKFSDLYVVMRNYIRTTIGWSDNSADRIGASVTLKIS